MAQRRPLESSKTAQPGAILLVVHEFIARSADELSLAKGDRIELIEKDDDFGDGWFLGRHIANSNTGLFPEVYTTPAPKGTLPTSKPASSGTANVVSSKSGIQQAGGKTTPNQTTNGAMSPPEEDKGLASPASKIAAAAAQTNVSRTTPNTSAVMNETLSVIDEHITDLNKPNTQSVAALRRGSGNSGSEYSAATTQAPPSRHSYIHGEETDEEEDEMKNLTEKDVLKWSPKKVATYLEGIGVDPAHCKVFLEQEFTGDVILGMDQASVFLKELDLGPVGRRLKTWQKIKSFQGVVKANGTPTGQRQVSGTQLVDPSAGSSQHSSTVNLPRAPASSYGTDSTVRASPAAESPNVSSGFGQSRPSAASIRNLGQTTSRRHSSIEQGSSAGTPTHKQQGSFDRSWTLTGAAGPTRKNRMPSPSPTMARHMYSLSSDQTGLERRYGDSPIIGTDDVERDYMSAGEMDIPRQRRVLRKKDPQYRASSYGSESRPSLYSQKSGYSGKSTEYIKRKDISSPIPGSAAHAASGSRDESFRVVSEPVVEQASAAVTKLDYNSNPVKSRANALSQGSLEQSDSIYRKGLRAISDSVTGRDKQVIRIPVDKISTIPQSPARTDASTPSATSTSMEFDDIAKAKIAAANTFPSLSSVRRKQKKQTSAYTRGLEKKSPREQMIGCDYSGWMKKKSSNLMTTWKPRLFVLSGRRLSYYYAEGDAEEKGLIDISGHRVLPADNEKITGLHAALTGAATSPTTPQTFGSSTTSNEVQSPSTTGASSATSPTIGTTPLTPSKEQGFIFKLVPPRAGMNKAVNFTKPTVHYFWVPNIQEGRLWMAALMKATIDRDESKEVITTYQQRTISLAKARARKERPPALREDDTVIPEDADENSDAGTPEPLEVRDGGEEFEATEMPSVMTTVPAVVDGATIEETSQDTEPRGQITEVTNLETTPETTILDKFTSGSKKSNRESSFKKLSLTARSFRSHSSSRQSSGAGKGLGIGISGLDEKTGNGSAEAEASPAEPQTS